MLLQLHRLKKTIATVDPTAENFKFHQSRATFATQVALIAARQLDGASAIGIVQDLLMHAKEETSARYIKFNEESALKANLSNEFTRVLLGGLRGTKSDTEGD